MKKALLVILDWVWINNKTTNENPFYKQYFPTFKYLFNNLETSLEASGRAVWIPDWQIGNSEVGHMTIWAWRILMQNIVKIDDMLDNWDFEKLEEFQDWIKHIEKHNSTLHLFTLFWPGWVHSSQSHLEKILNIIPENINIYLHLFTDWRDIAPKSFLWFYKDFKENILKNHKNITISSIAWRYFAMDRDNNWERIKSSYNQIVNKENITKLSIEEYVENEYSQDKTDEFITPIFFENWKEVRENDSVFFLNFRSDRAKQLTKAFTSEKFLEFKTKKFENLYFVTMTKYDKDYVWKFFIKDKKITNVLWEVIQNNWLTQLHLAETEKFAHVTKFFNWWNNNPFKNETDILVPSHKVATYDLDPEMSTDEIFKKLSENIINFDFWVVNFANWDMVWHTGNMEAVKKSLLKLDEIVKKIINISKENNIELFITADHWNCEEMWENNSPKTAHTTNQVPFWHISNWEIQKTQKTWWLSNIAPTILKTIWLEIPKEMDNTLI